MIKETQSGLLQSSLLSSRDGVVHGFSTRVMGDMRGVPPRKRLKVALGVFSYRLVGAEQVHGTHVHTVTEGDFGKTVRGVDGLVFRKIGSDTRVVLGIVTADCVPLLLVDSQNEVIGAAHAGWKGTLGQIAIKTVTLMQSLGAEKKNIRVALGPGICRQCYDVPRNRALRFQRMFGSTAVFESAGRWYLDLAQSNVTQLSDAGILPDHIDVSPMCSFEQSDTLYSWRREKPKLLGEQMALIGLT